MDHPERFREWMERYWSQRGVKTTSWQYRMFWDTAHLIGKCLALLEFNESLDMEGIEYEDWIKGNTCGLVYAPSGIVPSFAGLKGKQIIAEWPSFFKVQGIVCPAKILTQPERLSVAQNHFDKICIGLFEAQEFTLDPSTKLTEDNYWTEFFVGLYADVAYRYGCLKSLAEIAGELAGGQRKYSDVWGEELRSITIQYLTDPASIPKEAYHDLIRAVRLYMEAHKSRGKRPYTEGECKKYVDRIRRELGQIRPYTRKPSQRIICDFSD